MSTRLTINRRLRVAACLGAFLAAGCGGGGGGEAPPPPPELLQITALNEDAVARATAATFFSMTGVSSVPLPAPGTPAQAAGISRFTVHALGKAIAPSGTADAKVRLQAVSEETQQCAVSGSITVTIDDRDDNGLMSAGDVLTIAFSQCRTSASSLADGRLVLAIGGVSATQSSMQIRGSFTYDHLTFIDDGYTSAVNGATNSVYTESIDPMGSLTVRLESSVAAGGLVGSGSTPNFTETFTYDPGFGAVSTDFMPSTATPAPSSTIALNGTVHVASLGGRITLATDAMTPVHHWLDQPYPDSGQVTVHGKQSHLRLTVMNTLTVRCELDDDDDGVMEQSHDMLWTELMP